MDESTVFGGRAVGRDSSVGEPQVHEATAVEQPRPMVDWADDLTGLFEAVDEDWQEQALCAQTDPEAFFPEKGGSTREAKRICRACGVRDECLDFARANEERFGIWGGLSERERRRLKTQIG